MAVSTRQALLQALSSAGGSYVSGQQLAETLGVSRAAVHKAAAALTAQGYALEAAPRRGYRLAGGDPFCAEAIGDYPAPIYLYDTLESSNRTAKLLALDGAPHGTLVHHEDDRHRHALCRVVLLRDAEERAAAEEAVHDKVIDQQTADKNRQQIRPNVAHAAAPFFFDLFDSALTRISSRPSVMKPPGTCVMMPIG